MKRIIRNTPTILFICNALLPFCIIISLILGYDFTLYNYPVFVCILTVASIALTLLYLKFSNIKFNKTNKIFIALLLPTCIINGLCIVINSGFMLSIVFILICFICSVILFSEYDYNNVLKAISLGLSVLLFVILILLSLCNLLFGNFGSEKVVKISYSPKNTRIAKVIDNDQGALGGETEVYVYDNKKTIKSLICELSTSKKYVYSGGYGEFHNMDIHWKSEDILIINKKEYRFN